METRSHICVPKSCLWRDFFLSHLLLIRPHTHQAAISMIIQGSSGRRKTMQITKIPVATAIRLVCARAVVVMKRHRGRIGIPA